MYLLEVEPLDLGPDVRAVGLELAEADEHREPVRGPDAARIWSRVLPAVAGNEPWALDFFSHLDRLRDFCRRHEIAYRDTSQRSLVIPAPSPEALESLLDRFQGETFGARAGSQLKEGDSALEGELARRGVDAYHKAFPNYYFCGVCAFEDGSLVLLTEKLWASEVIRRIRRALQNLEVQIQLPA
ncbi:MAG TPA: hypothetical protein VEU52_11145 [Candidatus Limnocylindrales bacterium]|nr:hypothetical protein [Candidatus Limnocylindrales bacterium]